MWYGKTTDQKKRLFYWDEKKTKSELKPSGPYHWCVGFSPRFARRALSPVLNSIEGVLVGDIIHEDEAHGSPVIRRGDRPVALLTSSILHQHTQTQSHRTGTNARL